MATGIPRKRPNRDRGSSAQPRSDRPVDVVLSYPGKLSEAEVLQGREGTFVSLWPEVVEERVTNRLYCSDNLPVLLSLLNDKAVRGNGRLGYIDTPFSTGSIFQSRSQVDAYTDLVSGADFIEHLRRRLIVLRELLANDGSIYVHLDDNMVAQIKIVMDEVFGSDQFRNLITRKKCNPKNYTRKAFGNVSDFILFYTKSDDYVWSRPIEPWTEERALKEYEYIDRETGRRFKKVPVHAPGVRNGATGKLWRGKLPPPGKHWQYTPANLDEMDSRGEIFWSSNGNPRRKVYLDQSEGVGVQDMWLAFRDAHNQNVRVTGYPTEKNQDLLKRIILASSAKGDLVLDCFSGSGTTLAAAEELGRNWIGVDSSVEAIRTTLNRFAYGRAPMGDFVAKSPVEKSAPATLSLFPTETDRAKKRNSHTPISDFALFGTSPRNPELTKAVRRWNRTLPK